MSMTEPTNLALELCTVSQCWPNDGETADDFVERLMRAVDGITEDEFYGMSEQAQTWQELALLSHKNGEPLPELEGYDALPDVDAPKPARPVRANGEDAPKRPSRAKKETKAKKEPGERKVRTLTGTGKVAAIADIMISNPDASVEDIRKGLVHKGLSASDSVVPTFRSAFRNFLSRMNKAGKVKDLHINF